MDVSPQDPPTICLVDGKPITLAEVASVLKVEERWSLVDEAVREAVLQAAVAARGINVLDDELQIAANAFRAERGLHRAADMLAWLDARHLTIEAFEKGLSRGLTVKKLRAAIDEDEVRRYFFDHLEEFQWARFSQLVAADRETAVEVLAQVRDGEVGFASLARRHSVDAGSVPAGGYVGSARRRDLDPALAALVFSAPIEEPSGPVEIPSGWCLVKVWDRGGGVFDETVADRARDVVFEQWLRREIERARVEVML